MNFIPSNCSDLGNLVEKDSCFLNTTMNTEVGDIHCEPENLYVEWKIPNYLSQPQKADYYLRSPSFRFMYRNWNLLLSPNGWRCDNNVHNVALYLELQDSSSNYKVNISLGIKYSGTVLVKVGPGNFTFDKQGDKHGWHRVYDRRLLVQSPHCYMPGGTLTVFCEAKHSFGIDVASQTLPDGIPFLCHDIQDLLKNEKKSDVTIVVRGRTFRAHKLILEARSSVFAAALEQGKSSESDVIEVSDCDPDTFQEFLQYVYSCKMESVSWDNAVGLFSASSKYDIKDLKEKCVEFMTENLSLDTACDVLAVAHKHNETQLKTSAEKLLTENMRDILPTDKWKSFLIENYLLGVEVMMKFIPNNKQIVEGAGK